MGHMDWLEKSYYKYRKYIPGRFLYDSKHFAVRKALAVDMPTTDSLIEDRLREILSQAIRHVPYYRNTVHLSDKEIANEAPRDLLERFPYLEKAEIMSRQRDFLDERLNPKRLNYVTSGGSTGQGIGLWRTKQLGDIEKAFFVHEWGKFGFSLDKSRYLRIGADARRLAHETPTRVVGNRLLLSPYHVADGFKDHIVSALNDYKPDFIHAYPSSVAALATLIEPGSLDFKVRAVLLASEPVTDQQLLSIERVFNCPISVNYGLTERTNIAFARYQDGKLGPYVFDPLYGISENRNVGGRSEIVGTSLWNNVMPLIRYCTNDFGAIDQSGSCAILEGRDQEFLIDRFGNHIPGFAIVIDEVTWDFVKLYQVQQKEAGRITLAVVPRNGSLTQTQAAFVLDAQKKRWGSFFEIALNEVEDIPLTVAGKRRLVVSEVAR